MTEPEAMLLNTMLNVFSRKLDVGLIFLKDKVLFNQLYKEEGYPKQKGQEMHSKEM